MKLKGKFFYTKKEDAKDEETKSGNLLVRSGMVKKTSAGVYLWMPLGYKVIQKICGVVRDEMNKAGATEVSMPHLVSEEYYVQSGRKENFGPSLFSLTDRANRAYALAPTHEEIFTLAAKEQIHSYKDMPFNLYQIGHKYRDEARPRYGVIRSREFLMKDAYSFDRDEDAVLLSYQKMKNAYQNIFNRLGIDYKIVKASSGAMGGKLSEEFQAITEIGEDTLVLCPNCGYSSNREVSTFYAKEQETEQKLDLEKIATPNQRTIDEICQFLNVKESKIVKTLIYQIDDQFFAALVPGDHDVNEEAILQMTKGQEIVLANEEDVERITGAVKGFAGPVGLTIPIIIDDNVLSMKNYVVGANETDYHYKNVNNEDFTYQFHGSIALTKEGDLCSSCQNPLLFQKGIEIGNIFQLGTKYAEAFHLTYTDENNKENLVTMGCYGIGIERILASILEQKADEYGMVLPTEIAPFEVAIVVMNTKDEAQGAYAEKLYQNLQDQKIDVLLDDRDERGGIKLKDMELIGIPIIVIIGKNIEENHIEYKIRTEAEKYTASLEEAVDTIIGLVNHS